MADLAQSKSHIVLAQSAWNPQLEDHGAVLGASSTSCAAERVSSCSELLSASLDTEEASLCCQAPAGSWTDRVLLHRAQRPCLAHSQRMVSLGPHVALTLQEVGETERSSLLVATGSCIQAARPEADLLLALATALQVA